MGNPLDKLRAEQARRAAAKQAAQKAETPADRIKAQKALGGAKPDSYTQITQAMAERAKESNETGLRGAEGDGNRIVIEAEEGEIPLKGVPVAPAAAVATQIEAKPSNAKANNPIMEMEPELRAKCAFTLTTVQGKVVMAISFKPEATEHDIEDVEDALKSKRWGTEKPGEEAKGYDPQLGSRDGSTTLYITHTDPMVSLIEELQALDIPIHMKNFVSTLRFKSALATHGILWEPPTQSTGSRRSPG